MYSYLNLLQQCRKEGVRQKNRTGIDTFMIPGGMMQFDCSELFPIVTTKKVFFGQVKAELIGFIRGYSNAADFRALGCKIWDANANDPKANGGKWFSGGERRGTDDLGRIYGVQWRKWSSTEQNLMGAELRYLDQLAKMLDTICNDPTSRRIIVNAWRPDELHLMALPPCHLLFQVLLEQETKKMHMTMYQRSCDMFLGVPFNISSYALLLCLIAKATGYTPGQLTMFLSDVHIYENHLEQVDEQLGRYPRHKPTLRILYSPEEHVTPLQWIDSVCPEDIALDGYDPHPAIKGDMAA